MSVCASMRDIPKGQVAESFGKRRGTFPGECICFLSDINKRIEKEQGQVPPTKSGTNTVGGIVRTKLQRCELEGYD